MLGLLLLAILYLLQQGDRMSYYMPCKVESDIHVISFNIFMKVWQS